MKLNLKMLLQNYNAKQPPYFLPTVRSYLYLFSQSYLLINLKTIQRVLNVIKYKIRDSLLNLITPSHNTYLSNLLLVRMIFILSIKILYLITKLNSFIVCRIFKMKLITMLHLTTINSSETYLLIVYLGTNLLS